MSNNVTILKVIGNRRWFFFFFLWILFQVFSFAQNSWEKRQAVAVRVESAPKIDGVLDDLAWEKAIPISNFVQHEPQEGEPSSEKTEVLVVYDTEALYVGVKCHDTEPAKILVTESERDSDLVDTDSFWMVFDTFRDHQNGFVFGTNPSALEFDAQISREGQGGGGLGPGRAGSRRTQVGSGGGLNKNWDGNWAVATHTGQEGWMAEFKIPFNTLRFTRARDQIWGVNFARNIRRKNEQVYWSRVPRQWNLYRLTFAGELRGLEVEPPTNFKLTPYLIGSVQRDFEGRPEGKRTYLGDAGLDIKYSLTSSLTLDLTYNTDFAQVEVDEQQVNLTRFNLFFPEKRPFFLENAGTFAVGSPQQVELFFSRQIGFDGSGGVVPILGGARFTGKINRWNVGFLNIQAEAVGDCWLDSLACVIPGNNFTVARINREFGRRSSFGGIFIDKETTGSGIGQNDYNRTFGLDGRLGIGESFLATGYIAKTSTFHENDSEDAFDGPDHAYHLTGEYRTRTKRIWLGYTEVGGSFNPEVGFLRRKAYRHINTGMFTYLRPSSLKWLREIRPHLTYRVFYDLAGFKESERIHMDSHFEWENGSFFSPSVNITLEGFQQPAKILESDVPGTGMLVPPGSYRNTEIALAFYSNLSAPFSVEAGIDAGGFYSGNIRTYALALNWRRGSQFSTSVRYVHNDAELPVEGLGDEFGGDFRTNLVATRINYSFTSKVFLQSLIQYNDVADNWSANVRFGWLDTAGTGLFVVYNETQDLAAVDYGFRRRIPVGDPLNRALFIKFTRQFSIF